VVEHNSGESGIEANFAARFEVERRALYPFAAMCRAIIFRSVIAIRKPNQAKASRINHQPAKDYFQLPLKRQGDIQGCAFLFSGCIVRLKVFPNLCSEAVHRT
jgi:hypothetical protein